MTKKTAEVVFTICFVLSLFCFPVRGYSDTARNVAYASRGASKLVHGVIAIPKDVVEDSKRYIFPVGVITGALRGTFQTVAYTVSGAVDAARGAAPYAKYLVLL